MAEWARFSAGNGGAGGRLHRLNPGEFVSPGGGGGGGGGRQNIGGIPGIQGQLGGTHGTFRHGGFRVESVATSTEEPFVAAGAVEATSAVAVAALEGEYGWRRRRRWRFVVPAPGATASCMNKGSKSATVGDYRGRS